MIQAILVLNWVFDLFTEEDIVAIFVTKESHVEVLIATKEQPWGQFYCSENYYNFLSCDPPSEMRTWCGVLKIDEYEYKKSIC